MNPVRLLERLQWKTTVLLFELLQQAQLLTHGQEQDSATLTTHHGLLLNLMLSGYYAAFSFPLCSSPYQHIFSGPLLISEMGPVSQTAFPSSTGHLRNAPSSHLQMGIAAPVAELGGRVAGLTPRDILLRVRPRFEDYSYHRWRLQLQTGQGRRKAGSNELAHSRRSLLFMKTSLK